MQLASQDAHFPKRNFQGCDLETLNCPAKCKEVTGSWLTHAMLETMQTMGGQWDMELPSNLPDLKQTPNMQLQL